MKIIINCKQYYKQSKKSRWLYVICFFFLTISGFSQKTEVLTCEDADQVINNIEYGSIDKFEENLAALGQALAVLKENECWSSYIGCLNGFMIIHYYQRDYFEASKYAEQAIQAGQTYKLEDSYNYSVAIATKAIFVEAMGDYEQSIKLQKEALKLLERKEHDEQAVAISKENLGYSYWLKGDYQMAIPYFEQAQLPAGLSADYDRHINARLLMHIGNCYKDQGESEQALDYYKRSLAVHQQLPREQFYEQTEWIVYNGMVESYSQLDDKKKAIYYIDKAVAIQEKYPDLMMAYQSYLSFGKFYLEEKAFDKAQAYFEAARVAAHEEYNLYERHPSMALTEAAIGDLHTEKGDWNAAFEQYQKALVLISLDFQTNDKWANPNTEDLVDQLVGFDVLQSKANALYLYAQDQNGDQAALERALETHQLIMILIKNVRQGYLIEDAKFTFTEKVSPVYEQAIEVSLELNRLTQEGAYLEQAFLFAEANKAETLYESITNERAKNLADIPDALLEKERSIRTTLIFNEKSLLEEKQKKEVAQKRVQKLEDLIFELKEQYLLISQQLEEEYPSYFQMKTEFEDLTLESVREYLDKKMVLVEYTIGKDNSYAFFITKKDLKVYPIDASAEQLSDQVLLLRKHVSSPPPYEEKLDDYQAFVKTAHQLYLLLLEKGLNHIDDEIDRLAIIPDAGLSNLPFELLLTQPNSGTEIDYALRNLSYLLKGYAICYQYSARLMSLQNSREERSADQNNFIGFAPHFGNPSLQASRSCNEENLSSLRFNQEEVSKISELIGGKAYIADNAHLDNFLKEAPNYKIIHLATHACVNETEAALNRIFFTASNLSQHELNTLQLNAELVVLSACNTGVGELLKGEGVMSLARGFIQAGGNSLLTSLWAVDDYATSIQMIAYYENLIEGHPKDVALKEAKMAYFNQVDAELIHPFYWSSFVQFGKVGSIAEQESSNSWKLLLLCLVLGTGFGLWFWKRRISS